MGGTPSIRISLSLMPEGQAREVSFTLEKTTRYASYNQDWPQFMPWVGGKIGSGLEDFKHSGIAQSVWFNRFEVKEFSYTRVIRLK